MKQSVLLPAWLGILLAGCGASASGPTAPASAPADAPASARADQPGTVHLTEAEVAHLGVAVTAVQAARYVEAVDGFAVVVGRDTIAQAATEVTAARAASHQSHATLDRMRRLAGGAGADSASAQEGAERQTVADDAALELAQAKAFSTLGQPPGSPEHSAAILRGLAGSHVRLLKVSFPLGSFVDAVPQTLQVRRLDAVTAVGRVTAIWPAPADGTLPGRSYFATLEGAAVDDGERLLARAAQATPDAAAAGVLVPESALVLHGDRYGFYLQHAPGVFTHESIDINRALPGGYFLSEGIRAGDSVVTTGAGLLLARELNPAGAADADP